MQRLRPILLVGVALSCALACGKSEAPAAPAAEPKPETPAQQHTAQPANRPVLPQPIDESAARVVLTNWLAAQNKGEFGQYSNFYASRMYGEKRAGTRVYKFDRKGWLRDRERMFKKPMTVSAEHVEVHTDPLTANINFVQSFSQGNFSDRGPKRITLVRENGELRISTELMLSSTLAKGHEELAKDFHFVVQISGKSYAVLSEAAPRAWGKGKASPVHQARENGAYVVLQDTAELPPDTAALQGKALRVYAADGSTCDASVQKLKLMAAEVPHFGTVMYWNGVTDSSGADIPEAQRVPVKPEEVAEQVLAQVNDADLSLVGELSGCQGLFATSPKRTVEVFAPVEPDAETHTVALKDFTTLPAYKRALAEYQQAMREVPEEPVQPDWPQQTSLMGFGPDATYVAVHGRREGDCAAYYDALSAIFRREGRKLIPVSAGRRSTLPILVIDLDADGMLEFITGAGDFASRALERYVRDEAQPLSRVPFSYHDCPC